MISPNDNVSMALFCDFENVALGVRDANYEKFDIRLVLERLLLKGSIVIKKSYCDWDRYKAFKAPMHEANFELIEIPHVRQSGKNSADIRLVVDALDLCYTKSHVNTFVIISGDSDFSPLVSKLRENAKHVIGVGVKQSTSDLLIANCDEFIFYDDLVRESARSTSRRAARENTGGGRRAPEDDKRRKEDVEARRTQAVDIAVETFDALVTERGDSGKIWASVLKEAIKRRKPDFNESYYGFRAFGNLLEEAQSRGLLDVGRDEKSGTYVYRAHAGAGSGRNGGFDDATSDRMEMRAQAAPRNGSAVGGAAQAEEPALDHDAAATAAAPPASGSRRRSSRGRSGRKNSDVQTEAARHEAAATPQDTAAPAPAADAAPVATAAEVNAMNRDVEPAASGTPESSTAETPSKRAGANAGRRSSRTPAGAQTNRRSKGTATGTDAATASSDTSSTPSNTDTVATSTHRDSAVEAADTPVADAAPKAARKSPARPRRPRKTATPAVES
jgi:uncharacterized LabA/DUF88 family protein